MKTQESVLGNEHPDIATSFNNIGEVYMEQGDSNKALVYYFKALSIKKKVLGINHPEIANTLNNIGLAYKKLGNYANALE